MLTRVMSEMVLAATLLLVLAACNSMGDHLVVPTPDPDEYTAMQLTCLNATPTDTIYVAGFLTQTDGSPEAVILRSGNAGEDWSRVGSETHSMDDMIIQGLHFNDSLRGWACGVRIVNGETIPVVLRTEDGGGHWREARVPQGRRSLTSAISELHFQNDELGTLNVNFADESTGDMLVNVYKSNDGGRHWVIESFGGSDGSSVTDPAEQFVSADRGWRLGASLEDGTQVLHYTGSAGKVWVPRCQFHISQFLQYY